MATFKTPDNPNRLTDIMLHGRRGGEDPPRPDMVNHPQHYSWLRSLCGVEPIAICRHFGFNVGNALKYLMRNGKADIGLTAREKRIEDLRKAAFYINDEIARLQGEATEGKDVISEEYGNG